MAKHNQARNASPRNTPAAPMLVLGQSLQQALQQAPAVPALPTPAPGSLAAAATTLAANPATAGHPMVAMGVNPQVASTIVHPTQVVVTTAGAKPYNVRAGTQFNNVVSWQAVTAYLQANGGQATVGALAAHLQQLRNHANFAGYCVRRGYLVPVAG